LKLHPLRCRCGHLQGQVRHPEAANHGVCYCRDCQAYAHFLGRPGDILDAMGGTEVIATQPRYVSFTQGQDALVCMSLTDKGMLRWYARCCNTPIGNTPNSFGMPFVGLVHSCLEGGSRVERAPSIEQGFGPVRMRVNMTHAKGTPQRIPVSTFFSVLRFMSSLLGARLSGSHKQTPFFDAATGAPVVAPQVLTRAEWERVMAAV
jgi:hypothetical protein